MESTSGKTTAARTRCKTGLHPPFNTAVFSSETQERSVKILQGRVAELERFCGQLALENSVLKKPCICFRPTTPPGDRSPTGADARALGAATVYRAGRQPAPVYEHQQQQAKRDEQEARVRQATEQVILVFPGYGYRRVTRTLQRAGTRRVLRIMREHFWLCRSKRRTVRTTSSLHAYHRYPNLIANRQFHAPDRCWVADRTYIRLPKEFIYLACLLDAYSRKCIGWCLGRGLDHSLTLTALEMALQSREVRPGLIHYSDQGVQYANTDYVHRLFEVGACVSMAATGNPYQNAQAESFMKTLKAEEVYVNDYQTLEEASDNIGYFLQVVYNQRRLGYRPPDEFEQLYA